MATLLVVEDDPDVLSLLRTVLEEADHVVRTASTRRRAHEIIGEGGLDLIISDAVLRGGNGDDVAVSATVVGVPILLISGDSEKIRQLEERSVPCLQKPFRASAVVAMVIQLLGGGTT